MAKRERLVGLRLTEAEFQTMAALARKQGTTVSVLIRMALYQVHGAELSKVEQAPTSP